MRYIFGLSALILGIFLGIDYPDIDQKINFLMHRSILTHSLLLACITLLLLKIRNELQTRLFIAGLSLSTSIHLSFDLFPKQWTGYALIHIPMYGRTNAFFSWVWLAINIVFGMYLVLALITTGFEAILCLISISTTFIYYASQQSAFWQPLIIMIVAIFLALALLFKEKRSHILGSYN